MSSSGPRSLAAPMRPFCTLATWLAFFARVLSFLAAALAFAFAALGGELRRKRPLYCDGSMGRSLAAASELSGLRCFQK